MASQLTLKEDWGGNTPGAMVVAVLHQKIVLACARQAVQGIPLSRAFAKYMDCMEMLQMG